MNKWTAVDTALAVAIGLMVLVGVLVGQERRAASGRVLRLVHDGGSDSTVAFGISPNGSPSTAIVAGTSEKWLVVVEWEGRVSSVAAPLATWAKLREGDECVVEVSGSYVWSVRPKDGQ